MKKKEIEEKLLEYEEGRNTNVAITISAILFCAIVTMAYKLGIIGGMTFQLFGLLSVIAVIVMIWCVGSIIYSSLQIRTLSSKLPAAE
jgi:hypothetical protein